MTRRTHLTAPTCQNNKRESGGHEPVAVLVSFFIPSERTAESVGPATIFFCRPLPHPAAGWCTASTFFLPVPRSQHIDAQPMARPPALARSPLLYPAGGPAVARQPPWFGVGLWRHQHSHLPSLLSSSTSGIRDSGQPFDVGCGCGL